MGIEYLFNLARIHIFSPGLDHVLFPVHDEEITVLIDPGHIARMEPTVPQNCCCLVRLVPVPQHHLRSFDRQFADFSECHLFLPGLEIHDLCICVREGQADASFFALAVDWGAMSHGGRFGQTVTFYEFSFC